jgi:hypothetical protein
MAVRRFMILGKSGGELFDGGNFDGESAGTKFRRMLCLWSGKALPRR